MSFWLLDSEDEKLFATVGCLLEISSVNAHYRQEELLLNL